MKRCSVDGCDKPVDCRGLCPTHYYRVRRYGDPHTLRNPDDHVAEIFWAKVDRSAGPDACWPWTAWIDRGGYGQHSITRDGKVVSHKAHRFAYELAVGPIPEGMQLDHRCHTESDCEGGRGCLHRRCVNPSHFEVVTPRENALRGRSFSAINARKTHCVNGHPLVDGNLVLSGKGRRCLICRRAASLRYVERRRAS